MNRINIPFRSISTLPNYNEGECDNIVNLRSKNGVLQPVAPRRKIKELSIEYDIVFVHRGASYSNWIGVRGGVVYRSIDTTPQVLMSANNGDITSINQIGNVLVASSDDNCYYAVYKNGSYKVLGEIPDLPAASVFLAETRSATKNLTDANGEKLTVDILLNATVSAVNEVVSDFNEHFMDAFFLRYAFRMYDGSLIRHSSPMLVMPPTKYDEIGIANLTISREGEVTGTPTLNIKLFNIEVNIDLASIKEWSDIITSVDFFISRPVGVASAGNIIDGYWRPYAANGYNIFKIGTYDTRNSYPSGQAGRPSSNNPPNGGSTGSSGRYDADGNPIPGRTGENETHSEPYADAVMEFANTMEGRVLETSQFYHYYSIDVASSDSSETFKIPNKESSVGGKLSNVVYQELMTNDSFSHHKYGASIVRTHNNRLRMLNVKTTFFNGFGGRHFWYGSKYNGVDAENVEKQYSIEVKLQTADGEKKVVHHVAAQAFNFGAFISYPDPRAFEMIIYFEPVPGRNDFSPKMTFPLSPHPRLNIAYYLNEGLNPIQKRTDRVLGLLKDSPKSFIIESNKIKVSQVNNPFYFPTANTYLVGLGNILNESSYQMDVTDRNYGMYPLFVFTEDGVFTLAGQSSDAVHSSVQAPTYNDPPISTVICGTPHGVVFVSKSGLMLISQNGTIILSQQLQESFEPLAVPKLALKSELLSYSATHFMSFLQTIKKMTYNPIEDEIIIVSSDYNYSVVYNFREKFFYFSTEIFNGIVQNTYPQLYLLHGSEVKDMAQSDGDPEISLITRPMALGTLDIKHLRRIILRANMYEVNDLTFAAYRSNDGVNFTPIRGLMFKQNDVKDIDLGMLARQQYRYYVLLIQGKAKTFSRFYFADINFEKRYVNDKLR